MTKIIYNGQTTSLASTQKALYTAMLYDKNTPWPDINGEPDFVVWKYNSYSCAIIRTPLWHLCGYVGLNEPHPLYERATEDDEINNIWTHGGITWADRFTDIYGQERIDHLIRDGVLNQHIWWLGFDCGHYRDLIPKMVMNYPGESVLQGQYRNIQYVMSEVHQLANKLKTMEVL